LPDGRVWLGLAGFLVKGLGEGGPAVAAMVLESSKTRT